MEQGKTKATRRPRSDALRNRQRLVDAARVIFATGGPDASLEAVARRADVGIGTLYRHFPTRDVLFETVYRSEVDDVVALAERLSRTDEPMAALAAWLRANVDLVATKKGMLAALALAADGRAQLYADSLARLSTAADLLMERARDDGLIRSDIEAEELLRSLVGTCHMTPDGRTWRADVMRLMDVFLDGLRVRAA
ncbi:TetR/AcrR family transcriptional regulator [Pararhizobium mangrovi]|uniref:TetR/AcrR family transcriptional regulator n=1 Tax=Pararhizobium mangrovi TaxID=2590452 RepID=UPI002E253288